VGSLGQLITCNANPEESGTSRNRAGKDVR